MPFRDPKHAGAELALVIQRVGKTQDEIFGLLDAFEDVEKTTGNAADVETTRTAERLIGEALADFRNWHDDALAEISSLTAQRDPLTS